MEYTRVDTTQLKKAVDQAMAKIAEARKILDGSLILMTDAERVATPRTRSEFPKAGRALARAMVSHPEAAKVAGFDSEAVTEDLDNAEVLASLDETLEDFARRVADTRLSWLAEAYVPSLAAYGVAKVLARTDGELRSAIHPMAQVFATRRTAAAETKKAE